MKPSIEHELSSRTGLRGRIDKLAQEHLLKAQALRITAAILDEDDRRQALQAAPKKYLAAIHHRNGQEGLRPVVKRKTRQGHQSKAARLAQVVAYLREHPGALTIEIAQGIGVGRNRILNLAPEVARGKRSAGHRGGRMPMRWTLKK